MGYNFDIESNGKNPFISMEKARQNRSWAEPDVAGGVIEGAFGVMVRFSSGVNPEKAQN